jgi:hypothetical protein
MWLGQNPGNPDGTLSHSWMLNKKIQDGNWAEYVHLQVRIPRKFHGKIHGTNGNRMENPRTGWLFL